MNHLASAPSPQPATTPFDLDAAHSSRASPRWSLWNQDGLPWHLPGEIERLLPQFESYHPAMLDLLVELIDLQRQTGDLRLAVEQFLNDAASRTGLLDRRGFVQLAYSCSYPNQISRPQLPVPTPRTSTPTVTAARPLRLLELAAMRAAAKPLMIRGLLWLLPAGGTVTEIAQLCVCDLSLDGALPTVQIGGGRGRRPRTLQVSSWAAPDLAELAASSGDGYLLPLTPSVSRTDRTVAADQLLHNFMTILGFGDDPRVTSSSIRLAGLMAVREQFGTQAAANCAGTATLKQLRRELGCGCLAVYEDGGCPHLPPARRAGQERG